MPLSEGTLLSVPFQMKKSNDLYDVIFWVMLMDITSSTNAFTGSQADYKWLQYYN